MLKKFTFYKIFLILCKSRFMSQERLANKFKLQPENENFKVAFGTYNRKEPKIIYININSWIKPTNDGFIECVDKLDKVVKNNIKEIIAGNKLFTENVIITTDIAIKRMAEDKQSYLSIEIFLKQKGNLPIASKKIRSEVKIIVDKFIDKLNGFSNCFTFSFKKTIIYGKRINN